MGIFDSIFGSGDSGALTAQEAFAGILMGASGCDGHIADSEVGALVTTLVRMKLFERFTDKQYNQMLNKLHGTLKKKGVDALIDACAAAVPQALRETAFANACDIVLADGVVEPDEKEFMEKLRAKLAIDKGVALEIAQIMVVKNRG
jgi:tellurite resistance protein